MDAIPHVVEVNVIDERRLRVVFDDGVSGAIDFAAWEWRGIFEPLADPAFFARVEVDAELGTLVWPNGADIAPETLHAWVVNGREPAAA